MARFAPFSPPAHRTGRAGFPHPALGESSRLRMRQAVWIPLKLEEAEALFQPTVPVPASVQLGALMLGDPPLAEPIPNVRVDGSVGFREQKRG